MHANSTIRTETWWLRLTSSLRDFMFNAILRAGKKLNHGSGLPVEWANPLSYRPFEGGKAQNKNDFSVLKKFVDYSILRCKIVTVRPLISGMLRAAVVLLLACSANADYAYDPDPGATPWLVKFIILLVVCTVIAIVVLIVLRHANHGRALAAPILPTEQRALNHPGRFQIIGVDRNTKMDTRWTVDADSAENAKVKAELEGIIVTSVSQIGG